MPRYLQTLDIKSWSREGYQYYYHTTHEFSLISEIITVVTRPSRYSRLPCLCIFAFRVSKQFYLLWIWLYDFEGGTEGERYLVSPSRRCWKWICFGRVCKCKKEGRKGEESLLYATSLFFCCHVPCLWVLLSLTLLMPSWETSSNNDCLDCMTDLRSGTQWSTNISSYHNINIF